MSTSRVPLGDIADFVNGVAFKPADWEESGKRILRIQNLTDSTKPYNRTNRAVAKKYEVAPGDLLVSWSATLGVFVWEGPDTALVNQHIFRVVPDLDRSDANYLRHMLADALVEMERHLHGATMKHVNRREFLATTIPLPPLAEQKRIAEILDAADALRAKRRESLAQLDTLLQFTFLNMFGDPVTNPMGWSVRSIGELAGNEDGQRVPVRKADREKMAGEYPYYGASGVIDSVDNYLFDGERLLIGEDGANLVTRSTPIAFIAKGKYWVNNHAHVLAFTGDAELIFLEAMINAIDLKPYLSGTAQPKLNQKNLDRIPIPTPPLDLQHRFTTIVESVEQQSASQRAHLAELDTLFASLQSRAFRGDL